VAEGRKSLSRQNQRRFDHGEAKVVWGLWCGDRVYGGHGRKNLSFWQATPQAPLISTLRFPELTISTLSPGGKSTGHAGIGTSGWD